MTRPQPNALLTDTKTESAVLSNANSVYFQSTNLNCPQNESSSDCTTSMWYGINTVRSEKQAAALRQACPNTQCLRAASAGVEMHFIVPFCVR
jgi:hypothetical protein